MTNHAIPKISILTATYRSPDYLHRAIVSVLQQTASDWEMIIAPDDGASYTHLSTVDPRIRVVSSTQRETGPGQARNRALAQARGKYIAVLDDDDQLAPNFVTTVLAALRQTDIVTVPTKYISEEGKPIREIGMEKNNIDITHFSQLLGSMHVIAKRAIYKKWQDCFAQDVLHTCAMIDLAGGHIPIVRATHYLNTVRQNSTCTRRKDIDEAYTSVIAQLAVTPLSDHAQQATRNLFLYRRQMNKRYETANPLGLGYQEFIKSIL